jgi:hypothetical protein
MPVPAKSMAFEKADAVFCYRDGDVYWKAAIGPRCALSSPAGRVTPKGYRVIVYKGKPWSAHRLVFLLTSGYMPPEVDHINGVRSDNRRENLRAATLAENRRNARKRADNTSGVKGVYWVRKLGKWAASIQVDGKKVYVGVSDNLPELALRVEAARAKLHGEFANMG